MLNTATEAEVELLMKEDLTWTGLDASGSEAELLVWVGLGLESDSVVDCGRRTVFLAHAAVVEVATCLQGDEEGGRGLGVGFTQQGSEIKRKNENEIFEDLFQNVLEVRVTYSPDSRSPWVRCIRLRSACGSSRWEEALCTAGSQMHI